jgi:hypothetical protein
MYLTIRSRKGYGVFRLNYMQRILVKLQNRYITIKMSDIPINTGTYIHISLGGYSKTDFMLTCYKLELLLTYRGYVE